MFRNFPKFNSNNSVLINLFAYIFPTKKTFENIHNFLISKIHEKLYEIFIDFRVLFFSICSENIPKSLQDIINHSKYFISEIFSIMRNFHESLQNPSWNFSRFPIYSQILKENHVSVKIFLQFQNVACFPESSQIFSNLHKYHKFSYNVTKYFLIFPNLINFYKIS